MATFLSNGDLFFHYVLGRARVLVECDGVERGGESEAKPELRRSKAQSVQGSSTTTCINFKKAEDNLCI